MAKFPIDAPIKDVIKGFERLGFSVVREGNHVSMARDNPRTVLTQAGIPRDEFLKAYRK